MDMSPSHDGPKVKVPPPLVFFALLGIASLLEYRFGFDYPRRILGLRSWVALMVFFLD
jgi:hypothetical protein